MNDEKGFTLIEVIVVIAVVAILAAILAPSIAKNINDSKRARAQSETRTIASAIADFFKDTGRWPVRQNAGSDPYFYNIYSPGETPRFSGANTQHWMNDNTAWANRKSAFANHLFDNDPEGNGTVNEVNDYPCKANPQSRPSDFWWNGPYLEEMKPDPWGNHYSINVCYLWYNTTNAVWVLSAGADGVFNTRVDQAADTAVLNSENINSGDDIGTRIK